MKNNNETKTAFASCDCVAKEAIIKFARNLCESLTDNDIDEVFSQMLMIEEEVERGNYETLLEGLGDSFRIEKHAKGTDIDARMDELNVDLETVTEYEVEDGIVVVYMADDIED